VFKEGSLDVLPLEWYQALEGSYHNLANYDSLETLGLNEKTPESLKDYLSEALGLADTLPRRRWAKEVKSKSNGKKDHEVDLLSSFIQEEVICKGPL